MTQIVPVWMVVIASNEVATGAEMDDSAECTFYSFSLGSDDSKTILEKQWWFFQMLLLHNRKFGVSCSELGK